MCVGMLEWFYQPGETPPKVTEEMVPMTNPTATAVAPATHPCACGGITFRSFGKDETRTCLAVTKRTFAPGHDAKLKGELIRRELAGDVVVLDSGEVVSPTYFAGRFGFADMVSDGVRRGIEKAQAKAEKKAAKGKTAERKLAEAAKVVAPEPEPEAATVPATVQAKVGRWIYEGTLADGEFTYVNKKDETVSTRKFTLI